MANQTTSVTVKHPYPAYNWRHQPSGGHWQDAANLSGYVSGQGTDTLELSGATGAEAGYLKCIISNPAGATVETVIVELTSAASAPVITDGITDKTPYEGESAVYGPITVTGSPAPTLLWEAETADGNNTWADADTVFGIDGGQGTDTYTIPSTAPADNRDVRVTATNTEGSDVSQAALTVTPKLAFVSVEPTDKTVAASGGAPTEYLHDFARGNPITLGGFNGTPTDGVYTDPDHRPSDATGADSAGVIQTVTDNVPVIVGGSLSGNIWSEAAGTQGLQLEESRTNNIVNTDITAGTWAKSGGALVATHGSIPAPDGTLNAYHITNALGGWVNAASNSSTGDTKSIYARTVTGTGSIHLMGHNSVAGSLCALTENWQRFTLPVNTAETGGANIYAIDGRGSSTLDEALVYYPQAENGSFATSAILTSVGAVIRAATTCSATFAQLGDPLPAGGVSDDICGQLSLQLKFASTVTGDTTLFSIGDATNGIAILINGTTLTLRKYVGGTPTNLTLTTAAYAAGDDVDIRYRISASDMKLWWNVATTNANANGTALAAAASTATLEPGNVIAHQCRILPTAADDTAIGNWETWSPPT